MSKVFFSIIMFFQISSFAQRETNIWYFGNKAGLDFNTTPASRLLNSAMDTPEGSATLSDSDGNLLFYTNGVNIWNRNHQIMNTEGNLNGDISSTQSSLIVPHPGNDSLYYVFVVDDQAGSRGLNFSVVNIHLNNGLGKVIQKNIPLASPVCEKLTAFNLCDNRDVWIVVRLWNSNRFLSFLVDKNGLNPEPEISFGVNMISGHVWNTLGSMKISPDGNKIAACHSWGADFIELAKFNRQTGIVSDIERLYVTPLGFNGFETGPYGLEFSPNGKWMYVYCGYGQDLKSQIHQFDVSLSTIAEIQNSKKLVANLDYILPGSMQLGPDHKIYVTSFFDSALSVINKPDKPAPECDFQFEQIQLNRLSALGLPNFVQNYFNPAFGRYDFFAVNCATRNLNFQLNKTVNVDSVKWDFGDPASGNNNFSTGILPTHLYISDGFYTVTLLVYTSCTIDTITKKIYAGNLAISLPDTINNCSGDTVTLSVPYHDHIKYLWSNGSRTNFSKISTPGNHWVSVSAGCTFSDTTTIHFFPKPFFTLGNDTTICTGEDVFLDPRINNVKYEWNTGSTSPYISVSKVGEYWLKATNDFNCSLTDTILIKDKPFPVIFLGSDTTLCDTEELVLNPQIQPRNLQFEWHDGTSAPTYRVTKSGIYALKVSDECTIKSDTIGVTFKACPMGIPNAFTPNGDGKNDIFRAKYGIGVGEYELRVFNRYGQLIFRSASQLNGWDGMFKGKQQPEGTYVWMVWYKDRNTNKQVKLKGTVNLIR